MPIRLRAVHLAIAGSAIGVLLVALGAGAVRVEGAEQTASLQVTVRDPTGAVIVGARVVVRQDGDERDTVTNEQGVAVVTPLGTAPATVRVESPGFEPRVVTLRRVRESTRLSVDLQIEKLAVTINVSRDAREKGLDPRGDAFGRVLSADQIAMLPDDPDEMERVLTQMGGPGTTFRVNGFGGSRLPPKNRIRQIRFSFNTFSAEQHELGTPIVDIQTQPGTDRWHGSVNGSFRNRALTARYPYSPIASPEGTRRGGITFDGPLRSNSTSVSIATDALSVSEAQTILASGPDGTVAGIARRPAERRNLAIEIVQALRGAHTAHVEVTRFTASARNLGVGGADLPERAYSTAQRGFTVRLSDSGPVGKRFFNTARAQITSASTRSASLTTAPAIVVLDAFNAGGAQVDSSRHARELEAADDIDYARGHHAMRAGVLLQAGRYGSSDAGNALGTFTFASLEAYLAGRPATYTRRLGNPSIAYTFWRAGWFIQDDVKLRKSLTGSFGLRQEMQSHLGDRVNPSPRAGFTWAPRADGKLLVRGGAGIVYSWLESGVYERLLRLDGEHQYEVMAIDPPFTSDAFSERTQVLLPRGRNVMGADLCLPAVLSASVAVQQQFDLTTMIRATYTQQRGRDLFRGRNLNAPDADGDRPVADAANVVAVESTGRSRLDRLEITASRLDLKKGKARYMVSASYSIARQSNDTDGAFSVPSNAERPSADWGPSASDIRHRAVLMTSVGLPRNVHAMVLASASSAPPYNITSGTDDNRDGIFNERPAGVGRNSGRGAAELDLLARIGWTIGFGKVSTQEAIPSNPRRLAGDAQRDVIGTVNAALGAGARRYRLEFFAQLSNLPNYVNRTGFRGVVTSPFFGRATASLPPRRVEVGARLDF